MVWKSFFSARYTMYRSGHFPSLIFTILGKGMWIEECMNRIEATFEIFINAVTLLLSSQKTKVVAFLIPFCMLTTVLGMFLSNWIHSVQYRTCHAGAFAWRVLFSVIPFWSYCLPLKLTNLSLLAPIHCVRHYSMAWLYIIHRHSPGSSIWSLAVGIGLQLEFLVV